jgi:hypothetical protein
MSNVPQEVSNWAMQSIIFAICLRAEAEGVPVNSEDRILACKQEADDVARKLWESAMSECSEPVRLSEQTMKFADKVFAWCSEHRFGV